MGDIIHSIQGMTEGIGQIMLAFTLLFAVLQCFFGYKLLRAWIALIGFLIGFVLGFVITRSLIDGEAYLPAVIGIAAGFILAFVAFRIYLIGVFLYCGAIAAGAVNSLAFPSGDGWRVLSIVLCVLAFILVGLLAIKFARPCIIAVTAATGAVNAADALRQMFEELARNRMLVWGIIIALAAAGMLVQFYITRGAGRRR